MDRVSFNGTGHAVTISSGRQVCVYRDREAGRWQIKAGVLDDPIDHRSLVLSDEAFKAMLASIARHFDTTLPGAAA